MEWLHIIAVVSSIAITMMFFLYRLEKTIKKIENSPQSQLLKLSEIFLLMSRVEKKIDHLPEILKDSAKESIPKSKTKSPAKKKSKVQKPSLEE